MVFPPADCHYFICRVANQLRCNADEHASLYKPLVFVRKLFLDLLSCGEEKRTRGIGVIGVAGKNQLSSSERHGNDKTDKASFFTSRLDFGIDEYLDFWAEQRELVAFSSPNVKDLYICQTDSAY